MHFHEIIQPHPTSDNYHYAVVASVHPSLWSQMHKFLMASSNFHLLDKIEPQPDTWVVHVACTLKAARSQFETAWG